jgi:hypothetical protein
VVPPYEQDRFLHSDIAAATALVEAGRFAGFAAGLFP